jgi:MFS family permease
MLVLGGFASSAISDHFSRKSVMLIGVVATTFFTLLIPLVQNAEQLIIVRLLTGLGAGAAVSAAFPIAAELMPAQHRRTFSAIYEMALAISFTVVPFIALLLAGTPYAFRFLALPGGLAIVAQRFQQFLTGAMPMPRLFSVIGRSLCFRHRAPSPRRR